MRVLLDENIPHDLIAQLVGHTVLTVQGMGWAGVENGELLARAHDQADARVPDLLPLVSEILDALGRIGPGKIERVGA